MPYITSWECEPTGSTTTCVVLATSSDPIATSSPPTYYDWLMVNMFELFLVAFIAFGFWFANFREGKKIK